MADKQGFYWDLDECAWVRFPAPGPAIEIPRQPTAATATGIAEEREADVRSG